MEGEALLGLARHFANPSWRPDIFFIEMYPMLLAGTGWSAVKVASMLITHGYTMMSADQVDDFTSAFIAKANSLGGKPASVDDDEELLAVAESRGCRNYIFVSKTFDRHLLPPSPTGCNV